jgi:hypothetical protein
MKKTYTSQTEVSGIINSKGARLSKKDGKVLLLFGRQKLFAGTPQIG